jgi:hypothetical protein
VETSVKVLGMRVHVSDDVAEGTIRVESDYTPRFGAKQYQEAINAARSKQAYRPGSLLLSTPEWEKITCDYVSGILGLPAASLP